MSWFSKKEEKKEVNLPKLPELPTLPSRYGSLPKLEDSSESEKIHELPSFPANPLGEKFSQDTIKSAVEGKEEKEKFLEIEKPTIPKLNFQEIPDEETITPSKPFESPVKEDSSMKLSTMPLTKEEEPVFIRIDKFEETMKIIKETKEGIEGMEELLNETKKLKKKEEEELSLWEKEIHTMKQQIEKVDKDIFSKI